MLLENLSHRDLSESDNRLDQLLFQLVDYVMLDTLLLEEIGRGQLRQITIAVGFAPTTLQQVWRDRP